MIKFCPICSMELVANRDIPAHKQLYCLGSGNKKHFEMKIHYKTNSLVYEQNKFYSEKEIPELLSIMKRIENLNVFL